jgi:organic hydroperoxide reductase OsmC/OhrA
MRDTHEYAVTVEWLGNLGTGTSGYRDYSRKVVVRAVGRPDLPGSADVTFHGDPTRWNPEDLLVAALAQCHLLSYLHMAVRAGVRVLAYTDAATGTMHQQGLGGHFTGVTLRPTVTIAADSDPAAAHAAHEEAHVHCFIASSVNFPVRIEPTTLVGG